MKRYLTGCTARVRAGLSLIVAVVFILHLEYRLVMVAGRSMEPTLHDGDILLVKRHVGPAARMRGEVVVARWKGDLLVKRVVGLPGEIVSVREGVVHINGYPQDPCMGMAGTMELRPGLVLGDVVALLGDNRSMHPGEHVHAVVPRGEILGTVVARFNLRDTICLVPGRR